MDMTSQTRVSSIFLVSDDSRSVFVRNIVVSFITVTVNVNSSLGSDHSVETPTAN